MTEKLEALISPEVDTSWELDITPQGLKREALKWRLIDSSHVDLFVLWSSYRGMGGESLKDLWEISYLPGSAALFHDFAIIAQYKKRLEARKKFHEKEADK